MHNLEFLNPKFHDGENITVRLGTKWYDRVKPFDEVTLNGTSRRALIISTMTNVISKIPLTTLANEHDPDCRTREGLLECMAATYPDVTDWDTQVVTILEFVPD